MANPSQQDFSIARTLEENEMHPDEYDEHDDDYGYDGYYYSNNPYEKYKKNYNSKKKKVSAKKKALVIQVGKGTMTIPVDKLEEMRKTIRGIINKSMPSDCNKAKPAVATVNVDNCPTCGAALTSRLCAPYCPKCNKINMCNEYTGMPTGNWMTPL